MIYEWVDDCLGSFLLIKATAEPAASSLFNSIIASAWLLMAGYFVANITPPLQIKPTRSWLTTCLISMLIPFQ